MNTGYVKLGIAALLPAALCAILHFLINKTKFGKADKNLRQAVYGLLFGTLAVVGTEWGIPINGAQMNCRDAAVITAGLMFGAPAGIIAGVIGGLERWIAVTWGVGSFTRIACSVSTVIAGLYAAGLRRYMFEGKKPGVLISLAIGVVMEVFHLTMVFLTNMNMAAKAMEVVKACTAPMVIANGLSVMLSALVLIGLNRDKLKIERKRGVRISQTIQHWLLLTVIAAFLATSFFVFRLQERIASSQTDSLLSLAIDEIKDDIRDESDKNMLEITHKVSQDLMRMEIHAVAEKYGVAEISSVNPHGIIITSTVPQFIGFDMASGEQSAEFLCLLGDTEEFAQDYGPISYDENTMRKYAGIKTETGFLQVGYDAAQFQKDIDGRVVGITKNRHVGETGYILILDEQMGIVSAPEEIQDEYQLTAGDGMEAAEQNVTFPITVRGEKCFCRYSMVEGYYIVSLLPQTEALRMRNLALYVNTFMEILVFAILFGLIYLLIKKVVVNRIKDVNASLARITGGNLNETVNVRSNEEFASLSDDINSTVDTLKKYIGKAEEKIAQELELARNIQASALPNVFPAFPKRHDFDIYALMDPAKEVGGDFYDFYMTNQDTLQFLVADVSGKGIPAAMFMMRAKTELKTLTEADLPLNEVFTRGNAALCEGNDAGMFVTAWQGSVDLTSGLVRFANAGHNPPLVRHGDGKFEYLRSRAGFVLAGMEGVVYKIQEIQLEPGDVLFLYTDGVPEATNAASELFGEERLQEAINSLEFETMREMCEFIKSEVDKFVGEAPQFDDITMVALKFVGTPPAPFFPRM